MKGRDVHKIKEKGFIFGLVVGVLLFTALIPGILPSDNAEALVLQVASNCGKHQLCQSLEGTQFDLIKYSNRGVNIVVLYNGDRTGDISFNYSKKSYVIERGTVNDAIRFVSDHSYYWGFSLSQARKSTGFFKSEEIDGMYILKARYESSYEEMTPRVTITEKDGKIKVHITHERNDNNE